MKVKSRIRIPDQGQELDNDLSQESGPDLHQGQESNMVPHALKKAEKDKHYVKIFLKSRKNRLTGGKIEQA